MALVVADRVKVTTTTTGTGTLTLGSASTGYQDFSAVGDGNTTYYAISSVTGTEWEVGVGTYTASGTTLSRDTILSSSNAGSAVNFSAGTKDVYVVAPADKAVLEDASGNISVSGTVDGRDLSVDGAKLDNIEAGATADQTKTDIDALGIDADTVDGNHASAFATSAQGALADTALQGNETITLSGDVSGSGTTSISCTVADDSHNHTSLTSVTALSGTDWSLQTDVTSGVYDDATSNANYSRLNIDSLHTNGIGQGQTWIEGSALDFNATAYIGTGKAGGQTYKTVTINNPTAAVNGSGSNTIWHAGNDGSGSGLDADTLDGNEASAFVAVAGDTMTGNLTIDQGTAGDANLTLRADTDNNDEGDHPSMRFKQDGDAVDWRIGIGKDDADSGTTSNNLHITALAGSGIDLRYSDGTNSYKIWREDNDGSGSGLDADTVDGIEASSFLQGNQTITLSGDVTGSGTTSITCTVADDSHNHILTNIDEVYQPHSQALFIESGDASAATSGTNAYFNTQANSLSTGTNNVGMGISAGESITTGNYNVCIGTSAGRSITTNNFNTRVGYYAGYEYDAIGSTHLGAYAGGSSSGSYQACIGYQAGQTNFDSYAVCIGFRASQNMDGASHVSIGSNALLGSTSYTNADYNTAVGVDAGRLAYGTDRAVCIGNAAGYEAGYQGIYVGYSAGYNCNQGSYQTYVGYAAGRNGTGSHNTCIGYYSGYYMNGAYNTALGYGSGNSQSSATYYSGNYNIWLGYNAIPSSSTISNECTIGAASGVSAITAFRIPGTSTTITSSLLAHGGDIAAYYSSDERLKENINVIPDALSKVNALRGVTYDWTDEALEMRKSPDLKWTQRKEDVGVIAQEVEKVLPEIVMDREDGYKGIKYERLTALLIEAVKELSARVEELENGVS